MGFQSNDKKLAGISVPTPLCENQNKFFEFLTDTALCGALRAMRISGLEFLSENEKGSRKKRGAKLVTNFFFAMYRLWCMGTCGKSISSDSVYTDPKFKPFAALPLTAGHLKQNTLIFVQWDLRPVEKFAEKGRNYHLQLSRPLAAK